MATRHIAESMQQQKLYGSLRKTDQRAWLVDGDLTSLAAAKSAVETDVNKAHVAERTWIPRINGALEKADEFISGYTSGSDASDYDTLPARFQYPGMTWNL